jgi:predicted kinase
MAIGRGLGCAVLSSDVIRKELAGIPPTERHYDGFASGLYSRQSTQQTYNELLSRAGEYLGKNRTVVLDASFMKRSDRQAAHQIAVKYGVPFLAVECVVPDETIRRRLEARSKAGSVSDGRWEIFADIKKEFDPVTELAPGEHLILDTARSSGNINALLLQRINAL